MNLKLNGKIALVAGGSDGLGFATAKELLLEGARVALLSRSIEKLERAAETLEVDTGSRPMILSADVGDAMQITTAVQTVEQHWGGIDILLANAGGPKLGRFKELSEEDFFRAFEVNFMGMVRLIRGVLTTMKHRGGGRIGIITSQSAKEPLPGLLLSNTFRPGVVGLAKTLSVELAEDQILVNCFAPGRIQTARVDAVDHSVAQDRHVSLEIVRNQMRQGIPLGRYGQPEEFGKIAAFYLSFANTYVTGQTIVIDGGKGKSLY